jgi:hypothetical protein
MSDFKNLRTEMNNVVANLNTRLKQAGYNALSTSQGDVTNFNNILQALCEKAYTIKGINGNEANLLRAVQNVSLADSILDKMDPQINKEILSRLTNEHFGKDAVEDAVKNAKDNLTSPPDSNDASAITKDFKNFTLAYKKDTNSIIRIEK